MSDLTIDILFESIHAAIIGCIFIYLIVQGKRLCLRMSSGCRYILSGFGLLFLGTLLDITDNFPALNSFIVIGDTKYEAFIEKVFGYTLGSLLLAIGFWRFLPAILALRKSEDRLRKVIELNPMAMGIVAMDGKIEYINRRAVETFGYLPEDIPDMDSWWNVAYPDSTYRSKVFAHWMAQVETAIARNGEIKREEYLITCKNGEVKNTEVFGVPVSDKLIVMFEDITERCAREEEFRRLNQALTNMIRDKALLQKDLAGILASVTSAAAAALKTERVSVWAHNAERRGLTCLVCYDRTTGEQILDQVLAQAAYPTYFAALPNGEVIAAHDALSDPRTYEFGDNYLLPNGITSMLDVPIIVEGEIYGVVCFEHVGPARVWTNQEQNYATAVASFVTTSIEMSRRKAIELELRELNRELEQRVHSRTIQLQESLREHEAFSYSVSHDLRAPLRHINSYSAMLQEEHLALLPDQAKSYLERIHAASNRMGILIDDLLHLSRISRTEMRCVTVNLSATARNVVEMLQINSPERSVQVKIAEDLTAQGDPTLLRQMLENLLGNAWKYTSIKHDARIEFGRECWDSRHIFFIRDNGAGFDMSYADKLFQPFQRLHGVEFEGTGIGLATVKRIVERHEGKIWAESAPTQGATFYFILPGTPGNPGNDT